MFGGLVLLVVAACVSDVIDATTTTTDTVVENSTTSSPSPSTSSTATTIERPTTTTTVVPRTPGPSREWAAQQVEHFLAALSAGAYGQAAWRMENEGGTYPDQADDESVAEYLERICQEGACNGPYGVTVLPWRATALEWRVHVRHRNSESAELFLGRHEGQPVIFGVPPLVKSPPARPLVSDLFGTRPPDYVVIPRYDSFEVWRAGSGSWITSPDPGPVSAVEFELMAKSDWVVPLAVPSPTYPCLRVAPAPNNYPHMYEMAECGAAEWVQTHPLTSGPNRSVDGGWVGEISRAGTNLTIVGDSLGLIVAVMNADGELISGSDRPGITVLSADGRHLAYTDHVGPLSATSRTLVVRRVSDGGEVGRWAVEHDITCLEASGSWVLVCENWSAQVSGVKVPDFVTTINLSTGRVTTVETRARIYLPTPPEGQ